MKVKKRDIRPFVYGDKTMIWINLNLGITKFRMLFRKHFYSKMERESLKKFGEKEAIPKIINLQQYTRILWNDNLYHLATFVLQKYLQLDSTYDTK